MTQVTSARPHGATVTSSPRPCPRPLRASSSAALLGNARELRASCTDMVQENACMRVGRNGLDARHAANAASKHVETCVCICMNQVLLMAHARVCCFADAAARAFLVTPPRFAPVAGVRKYCCSVCSYQSKWKSRYDVHAMTLTHLRATIRM